MGNEIENVYFLTGLDIKLLFWSEKENMEHRREITNLLSG